METHSHVFRVNPFEINYLQVTLQSYDGMVVVRTIDPEAGLIELKTAPGCENLVFEIIRHLVKEEDISMRQDNAMRV